MPHYDQLKEALDDTPYLVVDAVSGAVFLSDEGALHHLLVDPVGPATIVNLGAGLERVAERLGTADREFGLGEIAAIAGWSYGLAYYHVVKNSVLVPTIRGFSGSGKGKGCEARFSWLDAYTAGLIRIIREAGLRTETARKLQPLFAQLIAERADPEPLTSGAS